MWICQIDIFRAKILLQIKKGLFQIYWLMFEGQFSAAPVLSTIPKSDTERSCPACNIFDLNCSRQFNWHEQTIRQGLIKTKPKEHAEVRKHSLWHSETLGRTRLRKVTCLLCIYKWLPTNIFRTMPYDNAWLSVYFFLYSRADLWLGMG